MRKNPERTKARRNEIISAAKDLFFEYGYDATSIRMIQERVGKQVAVFYYYFESKDEVFDYAIDMFLRDYKDGAEEILAGERVNPSIDLMKLVDFVHEEFHSFRVRYGDTLHWSVVSGIQSRLLQLIKKYTRQVLDSYISNGKAVVSVMGLDETCSILAYALGGCALKDDPDIYTRQHDELAKLIPTMIKYHEA